MTDEGRGGAGGGPDDGLAPSARSALSAEEWARLCLVMNGYIYSQTLATACDLDLFTCLSAHPGATREELGRRLGLPPHATRVLMLACCATGVVRRDGATGGYHNTELAEKVLTSTSPFSMLPFIQFNHRVQRRGCLHLTRALKEGSNAGLDEFPGSGATLYERLPQYPDLERLFQEGMGAYTRLSPKILDLPELSAVTHLLDVGGGDGSNAIALCHRLPELRVTLLDKPSVTRIARERVEGAGLAGRIACVEGDMFADPWPAGGTGVLLSHVVEIFSPEKVRDLYGKAFAALPRGGRLFVWTIMADDDETGSLQAAKSSIYFLCVASGEGMAYPARDHEEMIRAAGFPAVRRHSAADVDHGALVAVK